MIQPQIINSRPIGNAALASRVPDQIGFAKFVDFAEARRWRRDRYKADDAGVVTFDPAPPGRVELRLGSATGAIIGVIASAARKATDVPLSLLQR